MTRRPAPRPGLSLIEVLLALAILILALVAINSLVDLGSQQGAHARAATRGTRLAQAKMAEVEAGVVSLTSSTDGEFDGDDVGWRYSVTPESSGPPNLYTVTVRVSRDVKGKPHEIVLVQMVFDPTKTGSAAQAERPAPPDPTDSTTGTGGTTP
ncbi:MAG: hypothetical protein ACKODX_17680 [Gemmata sp.]